MDLLKKKKKRLLRQMPVLPLELSFHPAPPSLGLRMLLSVARLPSPPKQLAMTHPSSVWATR